MRIRREGATRQARATHTGSTPGSDEAKVTVSAELGWLESATLMAWVWVSCAPLSELNERNAVPPKVTVGPIAAICATRTGGVSGPE